VTRAQTTQAREAARASDTFAHNSHATGAITLALGAMFAAFMLLAACAGAAAFAHAQQTNNAVSAQRSALSLITNQVKSADATGAVRVDATQFGPTLVLTDQTGAGAFETRIFLDGGQIVEQYAAAGAELDSALATQIEASDTLNFELEQGKLTVTCAQGQATIALRSAGAAQTSQDAKNAEGSEGFVGVNSNASAVPEAQPSGAAETGAGIRDAEDGTGGTAEGGSE
jgi:hypothetical protein